MSGVRRKHTASALKSVPSWNFTPSQSEILFSSVEVTMMSKQAYLCRSSYIPLTSKILRFTIDSLSVTSAGQVISISCHSKDQHFSFAGAFHTSVKDTAVIIHRHDCENAASYWSNYLSHDFYLFFHSFREGLNSYHIYYLITFLLTEL